VNNQRPSRDETILKSMAESIGATLGTIAAKAGSVQKELTRKVTGAKTRVRRASSRRPKRLKGRGKGPSKRNASRMTSMRAKRKS
jgi:hypothetical protein